MQLSVGQESMLYIDECYTYKALWLTQQLIGKVAYIQVSVQY